MRVLILVCNLGLFFFLPRESSAQWQQLPGPGFCRMQDIVQFRGNAAPEYLATPNGVWSSADSLRTWAASGLQGFDVQRLFVFTDSGRDVLFAAVQSYRDAAEYTMLDEPPQSIYRSIDSGATWTLLRKWPATVVGFGQHGTDLVAAVGQSIFASRDIGENWSFLSALPPTLSTTITSTRGLVLSGDYVMAIGSYAFHGNHYSIARTRYGTEAWDTVSTTAGELIDLWIAGDTVFTGYINYYFSTDAGATWRQNNQIHSGRKYIDGVPVLAIAGGSQSFGEFPDVLSASINDIASDGSSVFAVVGRGVYRSSDHGTTWILPEGAAGLKDSLDNKTAYWNRFYNFDGEVYLGGRALWKWSGTEWKTIIDTPVISVAQQGKVFIAGLPEHWASVAAVRSVDDGITWSDATPPQIPGEAGTAFLATMGNQYYALNEGWYFPGENALFVSSDYGNNWLMLNMPDSVGYPRVFLSDRSRLFLGGDGGFWRSDDAATTWTYLPEINSPTFGKLLSGSVILGLTDFDNFRTYAGASLAQVSASGSATVLASGDSLSAIVSYTQDDSYAYIATASRGIWRTELKNLPQSEVEVVAASAISLQVFPNPSRGSAKISFFLTQRSNVKLEVLDECGTIQTTSLSQAREAGDNSITLDDRKLASGVYSLVLSWSTAGSAGQVTRAVTRLVIDR